jgi:hypothetical protein
MAANGREHQEFESGENGQEGCGFEPERFVLGVVEGDEAERAKDEGAGDDQKHHTDAQAFAFEKRVPEGGRSR